jgi:hypothetical protein
LRFFRFFVKYIVISSSLPRTQWRLTGSWTLQSPAAGTRRPRATSEPIHHLRALACRRRPSASAPGGHGIRRRRRALRHTRHARRQSGAHAVTRGRLHTVAPRSTNKQEQEGSATKAPPYERAPLDGSASVRAQISVIADRSLGRHDLHLSRAHGIVARQRIRAARVISRHRPGSSRGMAHPVLVGIGTQTTVTRILSTRVRLLACASTVA